MSPVTQYDWSVSATWDVETTMPWDEYTRRVSERLFGFRRQEVDGDHVTLARALAGDVYTVRIERLESGPPLRLRVSFRSVAD